MSLQANFKKIQAERGFTIVELLIVIVVIAILAAITIVAYANVTSRANSATALASAQNVAKKIEAYNAETGSYPLNIAALAADSSKSYYLPASTIDTTAFTASQKPDPATKVFVNKCGAGTSTAAITSYTGATVSYYKFDGGGSVQTINVGQTSGTGIYCLATTLQAS